MTNTERVSEREVLANLHGDATFYEVASQIRDSTQDLVPDKNACQNDWLLGLSPINFESMLVVFTLDLLKVLWTWAYFKHLVNDNA